MLLTELATINAANNCATLTLTLDELGRIASLMRAYASEHETYASGDALTPLERRTLGKLENTISLIMSEKEKLETLASRLMRLANEVVPVSAEPVEYLSAVGCKSTAISTATWNSETIQPSTNMTDDDLLEYLLAHSRTPLGQVDRSFMIRLFTLGGEPNTAQRLRDSSRKWYYVSEDDIELIVTMAWARRNEWTNE